MSTVTVIANIQHQVLFDVHNGTNSRQLPDANMLTNKYKESHMLYNMPTGQCSPTQIPKHSL